MIENKGTTKKDRTAYQHEYYIKNKTRLLENKRLYRQRKREELEQMKIELEELRKNINKAD